MEDTADILNNCMLYQCKFCDFKSSSKDEFLNHHKSHIKSLEEKILDDVRTLSNENNFKGQTLKRYLCSLCYIVFAEVDHVRNHMIKDHNYVSIEQKNGSNSLESGTKPNDSTADDELNSLQEEWLKPITLKDLRKKLRKGFSVRCSFKGCKYCLESDEDRIIHERCHVPDQKKTFRCFECQWEVKNWQNCLIHLWKEHRIEVDLLKCPFCAHKAPCSVQIFRHMSIHGHKNEYPCTECSEIFQKFSQLRGHMTNHKDTAKKGSRIRWYSEKNCEICGHKFANSKILSKHIKVVHNKIKPFICSVCGHKSARKAGLLIHMRQHTGEKPLKCKTCSFKAGDPSVLRKHELRHDISTNAPYKCPDCNYKSVQSITLKIHLKKYHPNRFKSVACDQCNFVSVNPDLLSRHIKDHQNGIIPNEDSNEVDRNMANVSGTVRSIPENPNQNIEISSDCFLPLESTDSMVHDPPVDTGGVTIPAHSEETQFPCFMNP